MMSFLPGLESSEVSDACAFRYIVHPAMAADTAASASQTASQSAKVFCCDATSAANRAVTPMATWPQPGTAVKDDARSIASRMKRRLSIARSCSAGGSSSVGFWKGRTTAMLLENTSRRHYCQVLCIIKPAADVLPSGGKRVAPPGGGRSRKKDAAAPVAAASRFERLRPSQ